MSCAGGPSGQPSPAVHELFGGSQIWKFTPCRCVCELIWNTADDPAVAFFLIRASAIGWMMIGPVVLHLFLELTGHRARRWKPLLAAIYGLSALLVLVGRLYVFGTITNSVMIIGRVTP